MAIFLQNKNDTSSWAVWKVDESIDELLGMLPRKEYYEQELLKFTSATRKLEWLSVRVLLYRLLGEEKRICYEPDGKPYLSDSPLRLSISHTKGYVAVIVGRAASVGIDIEQYGKRVHKVAARFMRDDEKVSAYEGDDTWSLLLHWSAKETLFKCVEGADADLKKLRLEVFEPRGEGQFRVYEYWTPRRQVLSVFYCLYSDFVLTWACH